MDSAWNALDAGLPTSAEGKGDPFNPAVTPITLETHFDIPANDWGSAIRLSWHQGGSMPEGPKRFIDLRKNNDEDHAAMFEGSKGTLVADFSGRMLLPNDKGGDLTYYKPRAKKDLIPPLGNFVKQWINACKSNFKTSCDFDYGGKMIEMMMLGLVAYRVGKKISYDGAAGKVTDVAEANELLRRTYRPGWTLNG